MFSTLLRRSSFKELHAAAGALVEVEVARCKIQQSRAQGRWLGNCAILQGGVGFVSIDVISGRWEMNVRFSDARFSFSNVIRDAGVFKAFNWNMFLMHVPQTKDCSYRLNSLCNLPLVLVNSLPRFNWKSHWTLASFCPDTTYTLLAGHPFELKFNGLDVSTWGSEIRQSAVHAVALL